MKVKPWAVKCIDLNNSNNFSYTVGNIYISDIKGGFYCDNGVYRATFYNANDFIKFSGSEFIEVDINTATNRFLVEIE